MTKLCQRVLGNQDIAFKGIPFHIGTTKQFFKDENRTIINVVYAVSFKSKHVTAFLGKQKQQKIYNFSSFFPLVLQESAEYLKVRIHGWVKEKVPQPAISSYNFHYDHNIEDKMAQGMLQHLKQDPFVYKDLIQCLATPAQFKERVIEEIGDDVF